MVFNTKEHIVKSLSDEWVHSSVKYIENTIIPMAHTWIEDYEPSFSIPYNNYKPVLMSYIEHCIDYTKQQIGDIFVQEVKRYGESEIIPHMLYWIKSSYEEYREKSMDELLSILHSKAILPPLYILELYSLNIDIYDIINNISSLDRIIYGSHNLLSKIKGSLEQSIIRELHSEAFMKRLEIELRNCLSNLMDVFIVS